MLRKVFSAFGIIMVIIALAIFFIAQSAPEISSIQQKVVIDAPVEKVWSHVLTFEQRQKWNPFVIGINDLETKTNGNDGEVGTIFSWTSAETVGSQTVTEVIPNKRFASSLHFISPFEGMAEESTELTSLSDNQTEVAWNYTQENKGFMNKLFVGTGVFKKMMNNSYSSGLEMLKKQAEL